MKLSRIQITLAIVTACFLTALCGCSSKPSVGDARLVFQRSCDVTSTKLLSFKKKDGQWSEIFGVKVYSLTFEAEAENVPDPDYKGKRAIVSGVIVFSRSEKGWSGSVQEVKVVRLASLGPVKAGPPQAIAADRSGQEPFHSPNEICLLYLHQIGLAFSTWSLDYFDTFPFNLPTARGGSKELCRPDPDGFDLNAQAHFARMSNELSTPKVLVCPADKSKTPKLQGWVLDDSNISYKLRTGPEVTETNPEEVLLWCPMHGHLVLAGGKVLTNTSGNARVLLEKYLGSRPAKH